ncbi:hypothetical protein [uncultured Cellulomonas sp.]|uniref:hypothetical protein n=1 Tax=uncultured Cellulomonas sp. TaxID=189682 RepID=UPI0028E974A5|nr:hypothetical protein [uncultured Cellulomonas sp.]
MITEITRIQVDTGPLWPQIAAVIVALIAAGVVAYQSVQTKRSADASLKAADAAANAADAAVLGLDVSRRMEVSTTRARMDQQMPTWSVTWLGWKEHMRSLGAAWADGLGSLLPAEDFVVPRDQGVYFGVVGAVNLHNDSERHVSLSVHSLRPGARQPGGVDIVLGPHETQTVDFVIARTVRDWLSGTPGLTDGGTWYGEGFTVAYDAPGDQGASDAWRLTITGSPLHPSSEDAGKVITEVKGLAAEHTQGRVYWLSRAQDRQLPDEELN